MGKKIVVLMLVSLYQIQAIEVVFEGRVIMGKDVAFEQRPETPQTYTPTLPYYMYDGNIVAVGYQDKNVALLALQTIVGRQDQIIRMSPQLPPNDTTVLHLKIVADASSGQQALKKLDNSQPVGEMFNIVNDKGAVIKSNCYLIAIKKDELSADDITKAVEALKIATAGKAS